MEKPFIQIQGDNLLISSHEVKPTEGYEPIKNETTGKVYPDCCEFHIGMHNDLKKWIKEFPNCCEQHKAMIGKWWFHINNYIDLPNKIINQVAFTESHIDKNIDTPEWQKKITDYIDYNVHSFGHPAIGLDRYLNILKRRLKQEVEKNEPHTSKYENLLEFIENYYTKSAKLDVPVILTTSRRFKLTTLCRSKLTTPCRFKLTT